MVHGGDGDSIQNLQAVHRVNAEGSQCWFNKTDAIDDFHRDTGVFSGFQQLGHGGFTHQWVAGDSVDNITRLGGVHHLLHDGGVDIFKFFVLFIQVIEAVVSRTVLRQTGYTVVLRGTQVDGLRVFQRAPCAARQIINFTRPKTEDGQTHNTSPAYGSVIIS